MNEQREEDHTANRFHRMNSDALEGHPLGLNIVSSFFFFMICIVRAIHPNTHTAGQPRRSIHLDMHRFGANHGVS